MTVIDVRTPAEYSQGHVAGSINIPLKDLPQKIDQVKKLAQPLIICCASGVRSQQAAILLRGQGIACEDGGGWTNVNRTISNTGK